MEKQQTGIYDSPHRHILVVDDGNDTRLMLKLGLQRAGYSVIEANSGKQALDLVYQNGLPQLVILDILMPDMDGFTVAKELLCLCYIPIIFLSALSDAKTKVEALDNYAEDYVSKPFHFEELLSRIRRVLTRVNLGQTTEPDSIIDERLRINFNHHYLCIDDNYVRLTPFEAQLMLLLYTNRGRIVSPEFLVANVGDIKETCTIETLRAHIRRLRIKIEPYVRRPRYIVTVRGKGYFLPTTIQK